MIGNVILGVGATQVVFTFKSINKTGNILESLIDIEMPSENGGYVLTSVDAGIPIVDLYRLCKYFEDHIAELKERKKASYVFVPEYLNFNLQALTGDIDSDGKGDFTLWFMVNVGRDPVNNFRVYAGFEGVADTDSIYAFASSLRSLLKKVEANDNNS